MHDTAESLVGTTLADKYELARLVGEGGMGVVYEARNVFINKKVAVKIMLGDISRDAEAIERFKREAAAAGSIGHPAICEVYDLVFDQALKRLFIVMELLTGESLDELIEKHVMIPVRAAADITRQMLEGLEAAHRAGIIHRDLKPENIFLARTPDANGYCVKIMDFGISKFKSGINVKTITKSGVILGTPYYMSPEQVEGRSDIDHRSDVYSTAAVLFRMLTGKMPYEAGNVSGILVQIATKPFPTLKDFDSKLPDVFGGIIAKATAKNADDRFASALDMKNALMKTGFCTNDKFIPTSKIAGVTAASPADTMSKSAPASTLAHIKTIQKSIRRNRSLRLIIPAFVVVIAVVVAAIGLNSFERGRTKAEDTYTKNIEILPAGKMAREEPGRIPALKAEKQEPSNPVDTAGTPDISVTISSWRKQCALSLAGKTIDGGPAVKIRRALLPANLVIKCGDETASHPLAADGPDAVTLQAPEAPATAAAAGGAGGKMGKMTKPPRKTGAKVKADAEAEAKKEKDGNAAGAKKEPEKTKGKLSTSLKTDYDD
ncbi:MAG: serine/threonine-protein kinase [Pseudomonadota bacterium]